MDARQTLQREDRLFSLVVFRWRRQDGGVGNCLLWAGSDLVNIAWILLTWKSRKIEDSLTVAIEHISQKGGVVSMPGRPVSLMNLIMFIQLKACGMLHSEEYLTDCTRGSKTVSAEVSACKRWLPQRRVFRRNRNAVWSENGLRISP